jgi:hypothetical protein
VDWWGDPDELGEGDLEGATFGEGSGCELLATGGDPLPQPGTVHEKAVEKETVGRETTEGKRTQPTVSGETVFS